MFSYSKNRNYIDSHLSKSDSVIRVSSGLIQMTGSYADYVIWWWSPLKLDISSACCIMVNVMLVNDAICSWYANLAVMTSPENGMDDLKLGIFNQRENLMQSIKNARKHLLQLSDYFHQTNTTVLTIIFVIKHRVIWLRLLCIVLIFDY